MNRRTWMNGKVMRLAVAVVMLLIAAGTLSAQRKTTKDTLVFANRDDVGTLALFADTSMQGGRVRMQIFEPLFYMQNDGSFAPALATEWTWNDATHLTLKLRQGVKFHNGNPFTADDVLFTLQYARKSKIGSRFAKIDLEKTKVIDPHTIQIAYSQPDGLAMILLGGTTLIMDKEYSEAKPEALAANPVGTGPYRFVKWVTGDSVTLQRNDAYWGEEKAIIKTLVFRNVNEITQRTIELQTGGVDFAFDVQATAIADLQKDKNLAVHIQPSATVNSLYLNVTGKRAFANEDLRKAAASAINARDIIKGAYDGNGNPPATFVSRSAPGFNKALTNKEFWPYDLAKAKEYFAKSGVAKGTTVNVIVDGNAFRIATCEIIKNQLAQIGLNLNIKQYDFGTAVGIALDPSKDWDIFLLGSAEPTAVGQVAWLNGGTGFVTYPQVNAEFKALADRILSTTNIAEQARLTNQIQAEVIARVPYIPVQEDRVLYGYSEQLKGIESAVWQGFAIMCKDIYFAK